MLDIQLWGELRSFVSENNVSILKALLSRRPSPETLNFHLAWSDETLLHKAVFEGRFEVAKLLIEAGANVRLLICGRQSPLHLILSAMNNEITATSIREMFTLFTDAGATVDGATAEISPLVPSDVIRAIVPEDTPFWLAANNDAPMLAVELTGGLDPNMKTANGMTLLHWACAGDAPECVLLLLDAGAEIDLKNDVDEEYIQEDSSQHSESELNSSENNFDEYCHIESNDEPYHDFDDREDESEGNTKPIFYCMHESSDCLECMINYGVDVNQSSKFYPYNRKRSWFDYTNKYPINFALAANSPACVTALVGAGAWVTEMEMKACRVTAPLATALKIHPVPVEALQSLLAAAGERALNDQVDRMPPLYWAVDNSTVDVVRMLVEGGANVDQEYKESIEYHSESSDDDSCYQKFDDILHFAENRLYDSMYRSQRSRVAHIVDYLKSLPRFSKECYCW